MKFDNILYVAPNFKNRKGGIASVLNTYKNCINDFHFFPSAYFSNKWLNFIFLPFFLISFSFYLLFHPQIKIVHIHGASRGSFYRKYFYFLIGKKIFSKKILYHIHGAEYHIFFNSAPPSIKKRVKKMIENSDALIVLSSEWKHFFKEHFKQNNIYVVNNIVGFNQIDTEKSNEVIQFIFLGRIGKRKGIYDIINAITNIKDKIEGKLVLTIGGDGEVQKLKEEINKNGLNKLITYVGWVNGSEKKEYLKTADVMIMPSYNEGLPISLLEAMSFTMPIISTNVGGIPQILKNDFNGVLVEPGNISEIENSILKYVNDKELISSHGANSYELVKDFFPDKVKESLSSIYKKLLENEH